MYSKCTQKAKRIPENPDISRLSGIFHFIPTLTSLLFLMFILYIFGGFEVVICTEIYLFYTLYNDSVVKSVVSKLFI